MDYWDNETTLGMPAAIVGILCVIFSTFDSVSDAGATIFPEDEAPFYNSDS